MAKKKIDIPGFTEGFKAEKKLAIRPLQDRIVVERVESEDVTPGGLIIPDKAREKPARGIVVAVGEGRANDDGVLIRIRIDIGATVLFGKYAGSETDIDGQTFIIMREDDVLGVLE